MCQDATRTYLDRAADNSFPTNRAALQDRAMSWAKINKALANWTDTLP
jgi:hypothetical protein